MSVYSYEMATADTGVRLECGIFTSDDIAVDDETHRQEFVENLGAAYQLAVPYRARLWWQQVDWFADIPAPDLEWTVDE